MKTLNEWLAFLESLHPKGEAGIELGLERVAIIKKLLNQKEFCPIILVAGTNGKGSVVAFLEAIFLSAGFKVGAYTSPHLCDFKERVKINGKKASESDFCAAFEKVKMACDCTNVALTYFEFVTLAAFEIFQNYHPDFLVLEMGLGARLDAVNIYEPSVSVLTSIALDHQNFLGDDVETIGFEKAHVFRAQTPAFVGESSPPFSVLEYAQKIGAHLQIFEKNFGLTVENHDSLRFWGKDFEMFSDFPKIKTPLQNAAIAVAVAKFFGVNDSAVLQGLKNATLCGRFEILQQNPLVILDVAHNPQALENLAKSWKNIERAPRFALLGMLKDKDIAGGLRFFKDQFDAWFLCDLKPPRGALAADLAAIIQKENLGGEIFLFESPKTAFKTILEKSPKNAKIAVFGSFQTLAGVL
mgnify:FL=1